VGAARLFAWLQGLLVAMLRYGREPKTASGIHCARELICSLASACHLPPAADEAFELLVEVTGAAGADDMSVGAPGVNVQHSSKLTGCWQLRRRLADGSCGAAYSRCTAASHGMMPGAVYWCHAESDSYLPAATFPLFILQPRAPRR
jgi:hypothetical protein